MKLIRNEDGIALVTSLMFTVLGLVISMTLLYMVLGGIKTSASLKRYKTALDATYGGTELITKEMLSKALEFSNYSSGSTTFRTYLLNEMGSLSNNATVSDCFKQHLTTPRRSWSVACATVSSSSPDISFQLNNGTYRVFSNIIDTSEWKITSIAGTGVLVTTSFAGNSDPTGSTSGAVASGLTGSLSKGGAGYGTNPTKIPHYPYIYKIEIQGERQNSPEEKGEVSVLYAY